MIPPGLTEMTNTFGKNTPVKQTMFSNSSGNRALLVSGTKIFWIGMDYIGRTVCSVVN
jgi:hypothetical protein